MKYLFLTFFFQVYGGGQLPEIVSFCCFVICIGIIISFIYLIIVDTAKSASVA